MRGIVDGGKFEEEGESGYRDRGSLALSEVPVGHVQPVHIWCLRKASREVAWSRELE